MPNALPLHLLLIAISHLVQEGASFPSQVRTRSANHRLEYNQLVTYGDNWTDTGNAYRLTGQQWPTAAYYKGRFSDGPVWAEYVSNSLGVELLNYAYDGVYQSCTHFLTSPHSFPDFSPLADQVERSIAHCTTTKSLHVFWAGANDFFNYPSLDASTVANSLFKFVKSLSQSLNPDDSEIVIINLPPLDELPYFNGNRGGANLFGNFAIDFNNVFAGLVDAYNKREKIRRVAIVDIWFNYPYLVGPFALIAEPCWPGGVTWGRVCEGYVFVDEYHFTTKMHEAIARLVLRKIGSSE
ncbi:hypothetical protein HDV00_008727 [Rhizophlyctis rosea]|nr:hypothetical protein HDV00_008727 [Rhizophlyctis rosea]